MKYTIADTAAIIRGLGLTARWRNGEWRINYAGGSEATAYYTDDHRDAINTAAQMALDMALAPADNAPPHGPNATVREPDGCYYCGEPFCAGACP